MQVLTAYVAEPGWRTEAFQRQKGAGRTIHDQAESTDQGVLNLTLSGLLHSGDRRFTVPEPRGDRQGRAGRPEGPDRPASGQRSYRGGDRGRHHGRKATDAVARTFGALPARAPEQPVPASQKAIAFPAPTPAPVVLTHKGRSDQAIGYVAWPTTDFWANPQRRARHRVMGEVMSLRLTDQLREAQGATYSPVGDLQPQPHLDRLGLCGRQRRGARIKARRRHARHRQDRRRPEGQGADAGRTGPRQEAPAGSARTGAADQPVLAKRALNAQSDPRKLDFIRQIIPGTERVSAADVQRAAATWLDAGKAYRVVVKPK
jgi:zinc protease